MKSFLLLIGVAAVSSRDSMESDTSAFSDSSRWTLAADSPFPSVWFGANVSGPDAPNLQRNNVLEYSSVWFGWQTLNGVDGCEHEETKLHSQTAAVKAARPAITTLAYGADVSNGQCFPREPCNFLTIRCLRSSVHLL